MGIMWGEKCGGAWRDYLTEGWSPWPFEFIPGETLMEAGWHVADRIRFAFQNHISDALKRRN